IQRNFTITSRGDRHPAGKSNCRRQYKTIVVVSVFADQIYAAGSAVHYGVAAKAGAELLGQIESVIHRNRQSIENRRSGQAADFEFARCRTLSFFRAPFLSGDDWPPRWRLPGHVP